MKIPSEILFARSFAAASLLLAGVAFAQNDCASLKDLALPDATVVSAEVVAEAPAMGAFCKVKGIATPTPDSRIQFEVWMPINDWNQTLLQLGNGGLAGSINYPPMQLEVSRHSAVAATDDGHTGQGTDASWALGHPEKMIDFAYRAVHETSKKSKLITAAFYGHAAKYTYFNGCSEGGREALMEAQRYPDDFNGILAGAPGAAWIPLMEGFAWNAQALLKDPASYIPETKRPLIEQAAVKACGTQNGVTDSFIKDPLACHFDPGPLLCKAGDAADCLTAPQLAALKKIYAGAVAPQTDRRLYPGYAPGAEAEPGIPGLSYSSYIYGAAAPATLNLIFSSAFLGNALFGDPKYSALRFDFSKDASTAERTLSPTFDATNPDLTAFKAHGGKMIHYHGWYDGSPSPFASVDYYRSVMTRMGGEEKTKDFYRLFMVPGMMHCATGPGPNAFGNALNMSQQLDPEHNIYSALRAWVEDGRKPDSIVATKFPGDDATKPAVMTRPLCPFPQQAIYRGKGSTSDSASFACRAR